MDSDESMSRRYSKYEHHTSFLFDSCSICASEIWHEGKKKKEKYILKINKQLKRFCLLLLFLKSDFFPCFLWAVEQKCQSKREGGWCKRAWAKGVKGELGSVCGGGKEGRGGRGGERPRGCCYENSHKDRLNMIKGLAKLCKNPTGRKKTKNAPK